MTDETAKKYFPSGPKGARLMAIVAISFAILVALMQNSGGESPTSKNLQGFNNFSKELSFSCEGVVVYGYESQGWIENKNDFPVKIQMDVFGGRGIGSNPDHTVWARVFEPGEKMKITKIISDSTFFYVYDYREGNKGHPIGFIAPKKPKK